MIHVPAKTPCGRIASEMKCVARHRAQCLRCAEIEADEAESLADNLHRRADAAWTAYLVASERRYSLRRRYNARRGE